MSPCHGTLQCANYMNNVHQNFGIGLLFAPEFAPNIMKYRVETLNLRSAESECEVACTNTTRHQPPGGGRVEEMAGNCEPK